MKIKISRRIKLILSIMLALAGLILLFNTNNNPTSFIERIFRPFNIGSGTFYYSGIIAMLFIYYGLKGINKFGGFQRLQTRRSRIIAVIIILIFTNGLNTAAVKIVKSMYKDLNAIYFDREHFNNRLEFKEFKEREEMLNCSITLENCSRETQEFYIKIQIPESHQGSVVQNELIAKTEDLAGDKKFVLHSKETQVINAVFLADLVDKNNKFNGSISEFEIMLVNDKGEVKFIREGAK